MTRLTDGVVSHRMSADMKIIPVNADSCEHTTREDETTSVPATDSINGVESSIGTAPNDTDCAPQKRNWTTPYERLSKDLSSDQKCLKEITLGKRIGFYRMRGELGCGNFSQVKLGIHALTKGKHVSCVCMRAHACVHVPPRTCPQVFELDLCIS